MIEAGISVVDVTPPPGLAMAGFAARTAPAVGMHDALTVRTLVIGDTALVAVDVIGLDADFCGRVRAAAPLPDGNIVVHATHTHGGPSSMPGRLPPDPDAEWLQSFETACIRSVREAMEARRPAKLVSGMGRDPDVARNRRRPDGPIDRSLPVLTVQRPDGTPLAVVVNYACHPVVLGADNRRWTADYPNFVRAAIERALPGATAIFLAGCVGDLNTGHSAAASLTTSAMTGRDFATAQRIGETIAECALGAEMAPLTGQASAREARMDLTFARRETLEPDVLAAQWQSEAQKADPVRAVLLDHWQRWARTIAPRPLDPFPARISLLDWGGMRLIGLPGEIFAATALGLRRHFADDPLMIAGFCEDNPGYIPPAEEFAHGGYEVDEAHRFYGQPASFAPGCAEQLARNAIEIA